MKTNINIEGRFSNILACLISQNFEISVECNKCSMRKDKLLISESITSEIKIKKGSRNHAEPMRYNIVMKCRGCGNQLLMDISKPSNTSFVQLEDTDIYYNASPVINDSYSTVSVFYSDTCTLVDVDNINLTIFSKANNKYEIEDISKRIVAVSSATEECVIEDFKIEMKVDL